jgi:uncharacterized membrane protein YkvA (DUF1232 family)
VLLRWLLGVLAVLAVTWVVFVAALALLRPRGIDLREAARLAPDVARLVRELAGDASLPRGVRRRLAFLVAYLALPIDLVPDVVPVLGYADDVVVIALVLRSVVRRAGPDAVERHWTGTPAGLAIVRSLAGIA